MQVEMMVSAIKENYYYWREQKGNYFGLDTQEWHFHRDLKGTGPHKED